jgi:hypothetical protein
LRLLCRSADAHEPWIRMSTPLAKPIAPLTSPGTDTPPRCVQVRGQQHWVEDESGRRPAFQKVAKHFPLAKRGLEATLEQKFARFGKVPAACPSAFELEERRAEKAGRAGV